MSTATQTPPESSRYVDYDEFIDFQVQKTRRGIKSNDLLTALIGAAVAMLAYLLVFALFDHWVIEGGFGRGTRIGLLSLLLTGLSGWFVWKLAIPYFKRISALYAASQIEETEPEFHSTLLTLVDLKEAGRSVSPEIRAALEKRAGLGLTHMDVEHAVDRRLLMRLSYVLLGLVVITCLYTILSPKKLSNSLWRSLLPTAAVAVDTRTRIDRVEPGDADVLARSQLVVTTELSGEMPDEVTLLYSTADRRLVDEPITMRETDDGIRQYRGIITGENGRGILQNLTYHIAAGDARSETFTVTVSQPPSATVDEVQYEYPAYMAFRDRVQIGGAIDAWEGTWVTIRATANMPVKSALVMFSDTDDITQKAEELPVTIENGTLLTARWQLRIRTDGTFPNFYRIQCRNEADKTDPAPALHPIKIRPDQPPQIQLVQPTSDLERPANAIVPLLFAAQDPDFLLRTVVLRFERNGESLPQSPRLYEGPPYRKSVTGTHDLDLGPLALQPGDKLTYWLEARDNMEPFADRAGNRSNTPRLNITITEAASPEEIQQQLEQDRQQVEERLDEAQQQPEQADAQPTPADKEDADSEDADGTPPPPPGEEPPTSESQSADDAPNDQPEQDSGQQGESQSQPGGQSSKSGEQSSGEQTGSPDGEDSQESQGQEQGESSGQGNQQGDQQAPFDDLLKRLMQRERPPAEQGEKDDAGQPQSQDDRQQGKSGSPQERSPSDDQRQAGDSNSGNEQSGEKQNRSDDRPETGPDGQPSDTEDSASPSSDSREGDKTGQPSSSPDSKASPSTGEPAQPGDRPSDSPQPGEGSSRGGKPTPDKTASAPPGQEAADSPDAAGGQREKPDGTETGDPKMSRKEGQANSGDRKPAPPGTKPDPSAKQDPTGTNGSKQPPGRTPPQGSPNGSEQSASDSGNQSGPPSGRPQPGEKGGSQPSSPSQRGSSPNKPGDASNPPDEQPNKGSSPSSEDKSPPSNGGEKQDGDNPPTAGEKGGGKEKGGEKSGGDQPLQGGQPDSGDQKNSGGQPESGDQPGEGAQSGQPAGGKQGGEQQGGGQEGGGKESGGQKGGQQAGGKPGRGGSPDGSAQSNQGGGSGPTGKFDPNRPPDPNGQAGGGEQARRGDGEGEAADTIQGDDPDLEAKRKAANLVLKRLQEQLQRGEIDPELQEELGVTNEQLKDFTERLQQRLADTGEDTSPEAQARRRQFEETLRTLDYKSTGTQRAGGDGPRIGSRGFAGPQRTAPLSRRDATRAFREKLSRQRKASN